MTEDGAEAYRPIGDYGYISDCHSGALVSRNGSIDWCCMPRVDAASVFGRLLDSGRGGYCSISPQAGDVTATRRYAGDSLVLETIFRGPSGEARLLDCFAMQTEERKPPYLQLLRVAEGIRGWIPLGLRIAPRFDYGEVEPWLRRRGTNVWSAIGGNDGLLIYCDCELEPHDRSELSASFRLHAGQRVRLSLEFMRPERLESSSATAPKPPEELDGRLDRTLAWWTQWAERLRVTGPNAAALRRSAIVLKGLQNPWTGAIAAAPTTSLPEVPGGDLNWDYRASWVRDSVFTVRSLAVLGADAEADQFRRFVERSSAGSVHSLQIAYGLGGERRLTELALDLEGYQGASPVRIGNAAARQTQLDVYGELLDLAWRWHRRGQSPEDDYWRFLLELVDTAAERWREPDSGIWEARDEPQHFVHSKVMCWVALDRGLKLAEECLRRAPVRRWAKVRDEIRSAVERDGYDSERGVFVQAFGSKAMDGALLLLPTVEFVPYDDDRMIRTTELIRDQLDDGFGLLMRRRTGSSERQRHRHEGAFIACCFWLVECLAHQGRLHEAKEIFDRASACGNDLGLMSEEYLGREAQLLGNYPQGLSHLSQITAAVALADHLDPAEE